MTIVINESVAVVVHNLGPYHVARFNVLKESLSDIHVIELARKVGIRDWCRPDCSGFHLSTLFDGDYFDADTKILAIQTKQELERLNPKCIVVASYSHPAMRAALEWARKRNVKTILFSESQYCDAPRNIIKEKLKAIWLKKYVSCTFASGARAASYFESLGFSGHKIWRGYSAVDNNWFSEQADLVRSNETETRLSLGLPKNYFLYVGRFSEEKNLLKLLDSYRKYLDISANEPWDLVIVGSGPQEEALRLFANKLELERVLWPGFKQLDELPKYYALASAFVLPSSREPWGLVVNEAMASSLPVLVSSRCGCTLDLVNPGINGWIMDPLSVNDMAAVMCRMVSHAIDHKNMGCASKSIVDKYTLETWSKSLTDCISFVLSDVCRDL